MMLKKILGMLMTWGISGRALASCTWQDGTCPLLPPAGPDGTQQEKTRPACWLGSQLPSPIIPAPSPLTVLAQDCHRPSEPP